MNGDDNDSRIREIINNSIRYLEIYLNNLNDGQKIPQSSKNMENNRKSHIKKNKKNAKNIKDKSYRTHQHAIQTPNTHNPSNKTIYEQEITLNENEYNIWKAYSWIEYSILQLRLKKYNLMDTYSTDKTISKKRNRKIVDNKKLIIELKQHLQNLDYDNHESLLNNLREIRNNLMIIVKKTILKR
ncbi:MAG TPA: hypothetical protein VJ767_09895 [Nitrososphaeraceae archaeon]|nr:hypothetical protein [Nitrososphaeraceae archaeon]